MNDLEKSRSENYKGSKPKLTRREIAYIYARAAEVRKKHDENKLKYYQLYGNVH